MSYFGTLMAQFFVKGLWAKAGLNLNGSNQDCSLNGFLTSVNTIRPRQVSSTNTSSFTFKSPCPRMHFSSTADHVADLLFMLGQASCTQTN